MNTIKYDLKFARDSFQNQFDYELHNKSVEMYDLFSNRLKIKLLFNYLLTYLYYRYGLVNEKIVKLKEKQEEVSKIYNIIINLN